MSAKRVCIVAALIVPGLCGCNRVAAEDTPPAAQANVRAVVGPVPGPVKLVADQAPVGDRNSIAAGRVLFNRFNCSGCHGDHGGGGMGPSVRDGEWLYGGSASQVFSSIAEGRAHGMPAWGTRLNDQQIWTLVAYIKSMRTPAEPERPE